MQPLDRNDALSSAVMTGRLGVVGAWLMVLYVVTIATAIMAFSAFQFQTALGSTEASGRALTIGELESERQSFIAGQKTIEAARENVRIMEANLARVNQEENRARSELHSMNVNFGRLRDEAVTTIWSLPFTNFKDPMTKKVMDDIGEMQGYLARFIATAEQDERGKVEEILRRINDTVVTKYALDAQLAYLDEQSNELVTSIDAGRNNIASLISTSSSRPELIGLFQQVEFFEGVPLGRSFATMPPALLIPIVTLAMGALGSVIYLSVSVVVGEPPRPFAWYLFRPMLGMVTAFAVFILVQAGALVITKPPAEGGDPGQLNPYFIAFVAIISGLLSEQAVERIRGVGGSFFSTPDRESPERREDRSTETQSAQTQ
jgi:hypothetical protein